MSTSEGLRIGIVGGGIAGLAAAWYASKRGAQVTLYEGSDQLGGLGRGFEHNGQTIERFYHCLIPSDRHLLALLEDIGLTDQLYWKATSFGLIQQRVLYSLNTATDLLRFAPLSLTDRVRIGLTGLKARFTSSDGLDDITCQQWLSGLSGPRAFDAFFKPMLQAKFGDAYRQVPALWFWARFNREKGRGPERKGYLHGGYRKIVNTLATELQRKGADIRLNASVSQVHTKDPEQITVCADGNHDSFDRVIYAGPIATLSDLIEPTLAGQLDESIDMQGVVNAVFLLNRPLGRHYWVATVDPDIPFQGIVETTTLLDKTDAPDHHRIYLMNYLHRTDPAFAETDQAIISHFFNSLKKLYPDLRDEHLIKAQVFRSPFVEPIYTTGYQSKMPPTELLTNKLFLATTAQVYPDITSWNGSTGLAARVVDQIFAHQPAVVQSEGDR